MRLSGATLETVTACDVRLGGDVIAHFDEGYIRADLYDLAAHFMANDAWRVNPAVCPGIPIVNMSICSAERGGRDADDRIGGTRFRVRPVGDGQPWLRGCFDERTHNPIVYQVVDSAYPSRKNGLREGLRGR